MRVFVHPTGWRFSPRKFPEADITRFVQNQPDRGDTADSWPCFGTVLMQCPSALVAKWAPGTVSHEAIDENTTRIHVGAWSWPGVIGFLITFDCPFTVESPPELAEAARKVVNRLERATPLPWHGRVR